MKSKKVIEDGKHRLSSVEESTKNMFERAEQSTLDFIHKTEDAGRHLLGSGKNLINKVNTTNTWVYN